MRKRWVGCWGSLFFFRKGGAGGGGKRIVPSSRLPADQGNTNINNNNNNVFSSSSVSHSLLPPPLDPSLLAPPSSPASFTHSALPSTAQSPNSSSFLSLSANSPGGPSSAIYATGPYAHEHQLVSPPVLSTFTTEPSTAPLTPPPELAHLTTPSSPDVPFAQFLSSNHHHHKGKTNYDLQAAYSLYPPSPPGSSGLISPSGDFVSQWDPSFSPQNSSAYPRTRSGRFFAHDTNPSSPMGVTASQDSNFFCPATFAQFYLDHAQETNPSFPHSGGRLSLSRESDTGNGHQNNKQQHNNNNKSSKQDAEEIEAYRASFGFSADEIITTPHYLEISDVLDDSSFTITPFTSSSYKDKEDDDLQPPPELTKAHEDHTDSHLLNQESSKLLAEEEVVADEMSPKRCSPMKGDVTQQGRKKGTSSRVLENGVIISDEEDIFAKMKLSKKYHMGSSSDAEIDYRRIGSSREGKGKRKDTYLKY